MLNIDVANLEFSTIFQIKFLYHVDEGISLVDIFVKKFFHLLTPFDIFSNVVGSFDYIIELNLQGYLYI